MVQPSHRGNSAAGGIKREVGTPEWPVKDRARASCWLDLWAAARPIDLPEAHIRRDALAEAHVSVRNPASTGI
jgi:hypothetical protein